MNTKHFTANVDSHVVAMNLSYVECRSKYVTSCVIYETVLNKLIRSYKELRLPRLLEDHRFMLEYFAMTPLELEIHLLSSTTPPVLGYQQYHTSAVNSFLLGSQLSWLYCLEFARPKERRDPQTAIIPQS